MRKLERRVQPCRTQSQSTAPGSPISSARRSQSVAHAKPSVHLLVQRRLLHDTQELLLVDLSVAIAVRLLDHLHELLIGHVLTNLLRHTSQVAQRNLSRLIIVEQSERFQHFLPRVSMAHFGGHHLQELVEVNRSGAISVDVGDHLLDLLPLGLEAKSAHGNLQFLGIDVSRPVSVEQVESLLDLLLLLLGEFVGSTTSLSPEARHVNKL
mmetsp:Transcript_7072/g.7940  ORF Transcript_7072/g.7940 Transcript_7072/m.7940 type:complete len:210 (+) Transcript_7072:77-706(+)